MFPAEIIWGALIIYLLRAGANQLCQQAIKQDRLPLALRYCQLKLVLYPLSKEGWAELGNLYGDLKQWSKAQAVFSNILRFGKHHGALLGAGTAQLALAKSPQESRLAHRFFSQINTSISSNENTYIDSVKLTQIMQNAGETFQKQGWMVIDDFLAPVTQQALHAYCQKPAIWQHKYKGYEGAHLDDGLSHLQLYHFAEQLCQTWPEVFKTHRLMYAWAFRYSENNKGVALHHDSSHINVNLWLTPDQHNLNPENGGLTLYPRNPPECWDLERYTLSTQQMKTFITNEKIEPVHIPYRCGRMVIFNSRFLHTSQNFTFKNQPHQRRLNLTLLFGQHPLRYFPRKTLPAHLFNQGARRE